jgi:hypothetical protein
MLGFFVSLFHKPKKQMDGVGIALVVFFCIIIVIAVGYAWSKRRRITRHQPPAKPSYADFMDHYPTRDRDAKEYAALEHKWGNRRQYSSQEADQMVRDMQRLQNSLTFSTHPGGARPTFTFS